MEKPKKQKLEFLVSWCEKLPFNMTLFRECGICKAENYFLCPYHTIKGKCVICEKDSSVKTDSYKKYALSEGAKA